MTDFTSIASSDFAINNESLFSDNESNYSSEKIFNDITSEEIYGIFNFKNAPYPLEEYNNKDYYLIPKLYTRTSGPKKKNLFIVSEKTNHITQLTKKKRGKPSSLNKIRTKVHDRFSIDNLLAKIKNHSLSLVAPFLNDILKVLSIEEEFYQLSHKFKKNIKNDYFSEAKKETLGKIICNKISPKYKCDENENIKTFNKVKDHEIFKKILNMNYTTFFKRYYMESKKCINLQDFGLDHEIILSDKCKMYNDLIERIKNSKNDDNEGYIKSMKKCIDKNYITKILFKTRK